MMPTCIIIMPPDDECRIRPCPGRGRGLKKSDGRLSPWFLAENQFLLRLLNVNGHCRLATTRISISATPVRPHNHQHHQTKRTRTMRRPFVLMLVGLLAFIAMVHLHFLNQLGLCADYSSCSSNTVKRRVDSQSTNITPAVVGLAVPAIVIADEAQQQASVRQQEQKPPPRPPPPPTQPQQSRNCTNFTTTTTAPEWLKIRPEHARWLHIGKAGGKRKTEKRCYLYGQIPSKTQKRTLFFYQQKNTYTHRWHFFGPFKNQVESEHTGMSSESL
jgi:hypothetical protein